MLLYIVRHGIPDYTTDTLTEAGRAQAEAVVSRFTANGLDRVFSSPLGRARQTAEPTANALGLPIEICPFMSERLAGEYFVRKTPEGHLRWAFLRRELVLGDPGLFSAQDSFSLGFYNDDAHAREGYLALAASSDAFFAELGYEKLEGVNAYRVREEKGLRVAAFCHGGFGLHWISYLLGVPPHLFTCSASFTHTGVTLFELRDEGEGIAYPRLLQHSDVSHLLAAGLPLRYDDNLGI